MVARKRDEALPIAAFWINLLAVAHFRVDFHCKFPQLALRYFPLSAWDLLSLCAVEPRICLT